MECISNSCLSFTGSLAESLFNSLRPRLNSRAFADDIFKCIFLNESEWILPSISLKYVLKVRINNIPALVQIMAWRRPGDKPLSETMMFSLLAHICVTRPQWVNSLISSDSGIIGSNDGQSPVRPQKRNIPCIYLVMTRFQYDACIDRTYFPRWTLIVVMQLLNHMNSNKSNPKVPQYITQIPHHFVPDMWNICAMHCETFVMGQFPKSGSRNESTWLAWCMYYLHPLCRGATIKTRQDLYRSFVKKNNTW